MVKVAVIGNAGGGKSTMARALATARHLPYHAVDKLQWRPGWTPVPEEEFTQAHEAILATERWIIDGWGPRAAIEKRLDQADTIIFVDHPLWVHFWWAAERQIACVTGERPDGPEGCPMLPMTRQLFEMIWHIHHEARPWLLAMIEMRRSTKSIMHIQSPEELDRFVADTCYAT
jgi:adenylate kinase family enzyme